MKIAILAALALALGQQAATETHARDQVKGFRYEPGRMPVGRVQRYRKSNRDGSNPSELALYLASETHLEALKWSSGEPEATLVLAEMDWETCSVSTFHTYHLDEHGTRTPRAELVTSPDRKRIDVQLGTLKLSCPVERFPWHSYDFDFSSLNVCMRFLAEPQGETEFAIMDFVQGKSGPEFVPRGGVTLSYVGKEEHAGLDCRLYNIDGPGLEDRGGSLWASDGDDVFIAGFEIDLPDEPGMSSGKLEWLRNETKAESEWETFVRERKE